MSDSSRIFLDLFVLFSAGKAGRLSSGAIGADVYSQVILMSVLTSLLAPSLLRRLLIPVAGVAGQQRPG
jgi:hypothetical protein